MTHRRTMMAMLAVVLLLAGCAGTPETSRLTQSPPTDLRRSVELTQVPFFAQTEYHCGPAALAAALNHSGTETTPDEIAAEIYTPGRTGTLQTEILSGTRRNGRVAIEIGSMQDGFREVAAGNPVLILQNLGLSFAEQWHYALLVGYDLDSGTAVLRSGTTRRLEMPIETLEHTWRRGEFWGVVVAAPQGPIPPTASMSEWMKGAVGLERVGRVEDAATAYASAAARWHSHAEPFIALANLYAARQQWQDAEAVLRKSVDRADSHTKPIAHNNLANVLMRRGKWEDAEAFAVKAVEAGGPFQNAAQETLDEIRKKRPAGES